jgi:hypothetical protein
MEHENEPVEPGHQRPRWGLTISGLTQLIITTALVFAVAEAASRGQREDIGSREIITFAGFALSLLTPAALLVHMRSASFFSFQVQVWLELVVILTSMEIGRSTDLSPPWIFLPPAALLFVIATVVCFFARDDGGPLGESCLTLFSSLVGLVLTAPLFYVIKFLLYIIYIIKYD